MVVLITVLPIFLKGHNICSDMSSPQPLKTVFLYSGCSLQVKSKATPIMGLDRPREFQEAQALRF
jgi:hypothetical protein